MEKLFEKVPHYNAKKVCTGVIATAALAGLAAGGCSNVKRNQVKDTAGIVRPIDNEENTSDIEFTSDLYLDFDIDDEFAVRQRAEDIYKISAKEISVTDIMNIIYLTNGAYEKIDFGSAINDTDKYKFLQDLILKIEGLLGDNVPGYVSILSVQEAANKLDPEEYEEELKNAFKNAKGEFVHAAYLMSENSEGKKLAIEFANVVEEQRDNIINGNAKNYLATAGKYIDLFNAASKAITEGNLTYGESTLITKDVKAKNPLITTWLTIVSKDFKTLENTEVFCNRYGVTTEELETFISKVENYGSTLGGIIASLDGNFASYTNLLGQTAAFELGIKQVVEDIEKNFKSTPIGDSYNASDAAEAQAIAGENSATVKVDEGGKDLGTETKVVSGGEVIGTEVSSEVEDKEEYEESVSEGGNVTSEYTFEETVDIPADVLAELAGIEEVYPGGEEVSEITTYVDDATLDTALTLN